MATAGKDDKAKAQGPEELNFSWEGKNKQGKVVRGEIKAASEAVANAALRRQGINVTKLKKQKAGGGGKVSEKDITLFSRQLATMVKSGVPLLQSFDIVGKGTSNPALAKLLFSIKAEVETGSNLANAFRKYPMYFDALFCNLVEAGEQAGILDTLLDRLATYKEKIQAIKAKIKSALTYPIAILIIAFIITAVIMIFVIPAFKGVFASFGGELPVPTLIVIAISDYFTANWYLIFGGIYAVFFAISQAFKRSRALQIAKDKYALKLPVFGDMLVKSSIARWTRTLSTMFAAGVPLVDALESVGGAAGNYVYEMGTKKIQAEVSTGSSLTVSMENSGLFPPMVTQMVAIGEESGQLDSMLGKTADFFEAEVDEAVEALSSLMEPLIMVFLGGLIGGLVVAMYLPIFKLGSVVDETPGMIALFADPAVVALAAGLLGLMVGSFLNVVIHRLPIMMERDWAAQCAELKGEAAPAVEPLSLARPRSRCPRCGHRISALENIPVISWLVLRGRCKGCAAPISLRYPLIEALTGLLFGLSAWHFGFTAAGLGALVLIAALLALTVIDFDTQLLPDDITLPLLWLGLALNAFSVYTDLKSAVIGAMAGYLSLWSVYWLFKLFTGKEGMGYGDFKLLAALGAWLGWQMLPLTILLSSLVGAVVGISLMAFARHGRNVPIPFGPYLAAAGLIALVWGKPLTLAYLGT